MTTPNGIEAEEGARGKTLRTLARSSTGSLLVLVEGVAGIWGLAGRFIAVEGGEGEAVEVLASWTEPKGSLSRAARPGLASIETVPVCVQWVVECGWRGET